MPVTEINHYFVRANDLEQTKDFYCDVLGFQVMPRPSFPFPGYWLGVNGKIQVHMGPHGIPNAEMYYLGTPKNAVTDHAGVVDHIAFVASEPGGFIRRFKERGVEFQPRSLPEFDLYQIFIKDPNGLTIELNTFWFFGPPPPPVFRSFVFGSSSCSRGTLSTASLPQKDGLRPVAMGRSRRSTSVLSIGSRPSSTKRVSARCWSSASPAPLASGSDGGWRTRISTHSATIFSTSSTECCARRARGARRGRRRLPPLAPPPCTYTWTISMIGPARGNAFEDQLRERSAGMRPAGNLNRRGIGSIENPVIALVGVRDEPAASRGEERLRRLLAAQSGE